MYRLRSRQYVHQVTYSKLLHRTGTTVTGGNPHHIPLITAHHVFCGEGPAHYVRNSRVRGMCHEIAKGVVGGF